MRNGAFNIGLMKTDNYEHNAWYFKLTMFCLSNFLKIEDCEGVFSYMQSSYIQVNTICVSTKQRFMLGL